MSGCHDPKIKPDIVLDKNKTYMIETEQGYVQISTLFGTHIRVWDDPDRNPVGMFSINSDDPK